MKILNWETVKNEGAIEVLNKMEKHIKSADPKIVELLTPLLDVIEEYKKQYK